MQDRYPNGHEGHADPTCGWGSGINQLRTEVEVCQDGNALYPDAVAQRLGAGHRGDEGRRRGDPRHRDPVLRLPRHARLRGARRRARRRRHHRRGAPARRAADPAYEGQPVEEWAIGWIEAGPQHMDGDTAQWYARSRYTTSDFDRMKRQRDAAGGDPRAVHAADRADAIPGCRGRRARTSSQTDLPQSLIPFLADLALKAKEQPVHDDRAHARAAAIDEYEPDFAYVQELVRQALHPPTPSRPP